MARAATATSRTSNTFCYRRAPGCGGCCLVCTAAGLLCSLATRPADAIEIYGNEVAEAAVMDAGDREISAAAQASRLSGVLPGRAPASDPGATTLMHLSGAWGLGHGWQAAAEVVLMASPGGPSGVGGWRISAQRVLDLGDEAPLSLSAVVNASGDAHGAFAAELRPVIAVQAGDMLAALNPVLILASDGSSSLEPCAKLRWQPPQGFALDLEYYAGLGPIDSPAVAGATTTQAVYAGLDVDVAGDADDPWQLRVAAGHPLQGGGGTDWSFKAAMVHAF